MTLTSNGDLSIREARQMVLAAQGFGGTHDGTDAARLRSVISNVGVLQIDSVNVLVRSQELPLFARLGQHDRNVLSAAVDRGTMFEYWVHEASLVPTELQPFLRWRMARPHPWLGNFYSRNKSLVERLYRRVRDEGPLKAADVSTRVGKKGTWWDWDEAKSALEYLFYAGRVTTRSRDRDFARVYDLTERVIPERILEMATPSEFEARRELLRRAATHLGVASFVDLADYHRQKPRDARAALDSLVEDRELIEVSVEGWDVPAFVPKRTRIGKRVSVCALLSPFDSLVWNRDRTERLFNFHYRIEIYTPKPKRKYGYYVLPVLCGDTLVGRLDAKADRVNGTLRIEAAYVEPGVSAKKVVGRVGAEVRRMARWLSLDRVEVQTRGNFARTLASVAVSPRSRTSRRTNSGR